MDIKYGYSYVPSDSLLFQGTAADLQRKYLDNGYHVVNGGNGSWNIAKSAYGTIHKYVDGVNEAKVVPTKNYIRDRYDKVKVTENDYKKLCKDLSAGKLNFEDIH